MYPYAIHGSESRFQPHYQFVSVDHHNSAVCVRSFQCTGMSHISSTACSSCLSIGHLVARVEEHACRSAINLDRATLSLFQLEQKLEAAEKRLKKERLLVCRVLLLSFTFFLHFLQRLDALKALRRLRIHKQTYQDFFDLAGANDIPGPHRIIKNSKHGGWSAEKLLHKTREALNGTYHPKTFSDVEFERASLMNSAKRSQ
jgi:hypothetical protein